MAARILRDFRRVLRRKELNTVDVTLIYDDAGVPTDPNDEAQETSGMEQTETVRALFKNVATGEAVQMGAMEAGVSDAIADFDPAVDLNRRNLRFIIDGKTYAQRRNAKDVPEYFDTHVGGVRMCRTVPLVLVPQSESPRLIGVRTGTVRYRSASEDIALYGYAPAAGIFTALQLTAGRAVIAAADDGTHVFSITFGGVKALGIKADGTLETSALHADGGTAPASLPALEFHMGGVRYASLTAGGVLTVPEFDTAAAEPEIAGSFRLADADGGWLATVGLRRTQARAVDTLA